MELFIDTSCDYIQLAIKKANTKIFTVQLLAGKKMSESILPLLDNLLKSVNINKSNINEIIVCTGPGSFTGVRIGVALAQGLSLGLGIKCKGISTLDIMACYQHFVQKEDNFKVASLINGNIYAIKHYNFNKNIFSEYSLNETISKDNFIASYPTLPNIIDILPYDIPQRFFTEGTPLYLMKPQAEIDAKCR